MISTSGLSTQTRANPPHSVFYENLHYVASETISHVVDNACSPHGNKSKSAGHRLKLCLLNAHSVCNKGDLLCDFIAENDYDVVCLTEARLKDSNHSNVVTSQLLPTGYNLRHAPRKKGRGGGLAVVYKSQLTVQMLQPRPTASMECMEIDLTCASQKLSLCLIYRPPRHFGSAFL